MFSATSTALVQLLSFCDSGLGRRLENPPVLAPHTLT